MILANLSGLYGDRLVSATELNRQPGNVLDLAMGQPVTITRNNQAFALLKREEMHELLFAFEQSQKLVQLSNGAMTLLAGRSLGENHRLNWLTGFDSEELQQLLRELQETFQQIEAGQQDWQELEAVMHEWEESGRAIASPELAIAFKAEAEEVEIHPSI